MENLTTLSKNVQEPAEARTILEEIVRDGARMMLQSAIENEVEEFVARFSAHRDEGGRALVVRNGYLPEREILTGIGPIPTRQPRVDDRAIRTDKDTPVFSSAILPRYARRLPSLDNLIPALYLKGVSTNDFPSALQAILGPKAAGLSASNIVRLKSRWEEEYKDWSKRDLSGKSYVYIWADGIHFNVRLDDHRSCILVIMGADERGNKELIAVDDGYWESTASWKELLVDVKRRGLKFSPKLATGDGGLGLWGALREVYPHIREQRCWVHKTGNILDKMPKSVRQKAKSDIHDMYMAETKENALKAFDHFVEKYQDKYPKAVECLTKDKDTLFTFYDFPSTHWIHIRTTNPIESTFATVRNRTYKTKGCGSRSATLSMVYKLTLEASKTWQKLRGSNLIRLVVEGRKFIDGELQNAA